MIVVLIVTSVITTGIIGIVASIEWLSDFIKGPRQV